MKIQLFDSWNGKFSTPIRFHWESLGHTVTYNQQYAEEEPADLAFFYTADNATQVGVTECNAKRIFVNCVDIEIWAGQADGVDWEKVEGAIFMAKHIRDRVRLPNQVKALLTKPGIDLTKFTLKPTFEHSKPIRKIAYVVGDGRIWDVKRLDIALQLLYDVRKLRPEYIWQLFIRGTYSGHVQYNSYCDHLIRELNLKDFIIFEPRVDDLNAWLNDKDYFLLPSTKEAFSYATAEAMAKGITPVINNWESARETWGEFVSNSYLEMLEKFMTDEQDLERYRKFIEENYDQERYFRDLDRFMGVI